MKQKLIFVLSLMAMAWSSAVYAAERVAPTLPTAQTPESGKSYWIYNVGAKMFLDYEMYGDFYAGLSTDGIDFWLATIEEGFSIRRASADGDYLYAGHWDEYIYYQDYNGEWGDVWTIASAETVEGEYTIQRYHKHDSYNPNEYVGYKENGDQCIYSNLGESNIVWQFFNSADAARYAAELKLYQALENVDGTALEGCDWFLGQYETLYSNRASASIVDLTNAAQIISRCLAFSEVYVYPSWNDFPIIYEASEGIGNYYDDKWEPSSNGNGFSHRIYSGNSVRLTARLSVDKPSYFLYNLDLYQDSYCKVFVDEVETRMVDWNQVDEYNNRLFESLSVGTHTITWEFSWVDNDNNDYYNSSSCGIRDLGSIASPLISVSLLEPGSLGTEVLYNTDHIKNVHSLKVKGKMNGDDWEKIKMMSELIDLDLSEAVITTVPEREFENQYFLRKVILPEGIESVEDHVFSSSSLEETNFPSTLKNIGSDAYNKTHLSEIILPDGLALLEDNSFRYNLRLKKVDLGKTLKILPYACFEGCRTLKDLTLPNTLEVIRGSAFGSCNRLSISTLPSSLKTIGSYAFENCDNIVTMIIPSSVTTISYNAFAACDNLKEVEVPIGIWDFSKPYDNGMVFRDCWNIETVKLNSATVVRYNNNGYDPVSNINQVTLQVPSFLVNAYKQHPYWYNAKAIEGFDPNENEYYEIHQNLILNGRERFGTNPSVKVFQYNYLKMNGNEVQKFNDFQIDNMAQMWCTGDNIQAAGTVSVVYNTEANKWYFISLPFDIKVSEIYAGDAQFAIRYYDGVNRATNGASGSWKNYEAEDIIPAGTGFIYQTNKGMWTTFHAYAEGANKQQMFSTREFVKPLALHASENSANRGWNLVGNPYQTYYNNHMLNFTAPITVWNESNRTYTAYSLTDDDYAIRPNEAFFVQCPGEEVQSISFPTTGKQLTNVIENQNAAKERMAQAQRNRLLIDLEVNSDGLVDKTRVVVNEGASLDYDMECDASKFMSTGTETPQIYTIGDEGTAYAINERPLVEGEVQLGFYTEKSGAFTISMPRCDAKKVYLVDKFENLTVDLSAQDYGFTAAEGKQEGRFMLMIESDEATGIESVGKQEAVTGNDVLYNVNGQRVGSDYKGIVIKNGKKVLVK